MDLRGETPEIEAFRLGNAGVTTSRDPTFGVWSCASTLSRKHEPALRACPFLAVAF